MATPSPTSLPQPGATVTLPSGTHGLLTLLSSAIAEESTLRLEVVTSAGTGYITLHQGAVRQVSFGNRGGMAALVALDVLANGAVRGSHATAVSDQFGLLPSIILDQARRTSAVVQGLAVIPAPVLAEDSVLGTPIPAEDTSTDDLLTRAKVTMTVRGDGAEVSDPGEDFPEEFFTDLAANAATATTHLMAEAPESPVWEAPPLGQMLGKCYLSAEIGRGASAIVYRALQMSLKVDVALKVFIPEDARRPHLSIREARVLARLNHPNILRVLDCSEDPPWPHLVMEYVDGSSLADLISQAGRLPPLTAVGLVLQAARGLDYAHAEGVTHCDVKPGNLLINRRHEVKVADLGVARLALGQDIDEQIDARAVVGTPAYIAPELVRDGIAAAGAASDLYSLGATLYHALCGEPPFLHDDPVELMVLQVRARHQPLRERLPGLDRELDALVESLLAKNPLDRPDYEMVIDALNRIDQRLRAQAQPRSGSAIYATVRAALRGTVDQILSRTTGRFIARKHP